MLGAEAASDLISQITPHSKSANNKRPEYSLSCRLKMGFDMKNRLSVLTVDELPDRECGPREMALISSTNDRTLRLTYQTVNEFSMAFSVYSRGEALNRKTENSR